MALKHHLGVLVLIGALTCGTTPAATVTLTLYSSRNGQTVPPGTAIDWTIKVVDSTGDNAGLALLCVDLAQNDTNPAFFDLPAGVADSIDATMQHFNRPGGVANPGENGALSGYIGSQRGQPGHKNLVQIGGGQNTFGSPLPPGSGIGENANLVAGVGQGAQPQVVLSGSFTAPTTRGSYTLHLANGLANVLTVVHLPPELSPVGSATVDLADAGITFDVGFARGDTNCDGAVNAFDIDPFILALTSTPPDYPQYYARFPTCDILTADCNGDDLVNAFDIDPFIGLLTSP